MSNPLAPFLIRIFRQDGEIIGAGFLVSDRHALTCAHVVADALGINRTTPDHPTTEIKFDFPLLAPGKKLTAKVSVWCPIRSADHEQPRGDEDIALLEILGDLPHESRPAISASTHVGIGEEFKTFGFPKGYDRGQPADGRTKGLIADGCVVIEDPANTGYFVERGFSGAPVWSNNTVIGMIVSADKKSLRTAYMTPSSLLRQYVRAARLQETKRSGTYKNILPPSSPYLCDRSEQKDEFSKALDLHQSRRPLLCVIHGDELECHDKFIDRLKTDLLPTLLSRDIPIDALYWREPPSLRSTVEQFWLNFGAEILAVPPKSVKQCRERFRQMLNESTDPFFVHIGWYTENCESGSKKRFSSFLLFLEDWQELLPANRLVICGLSLTYQRSKESPSRFSLWRKSPNDCLRELLPTLKPNEPDKLSLVVLPELQAITRSQAEAWPSHPKVRSNCAIPKERISELYRRYKDQPIAMEKLAQILQLLQRLPDEQPIAEETWKKIENLLSDQLPFKRN